MFLEVSRFVFGDQAVKGLGEKRKEAVVVAGYGIGQHSLIRRHEMLKVNVERR